jgi:hypothetical protein
MSDGVSPDTGVPSRTPSLVGAGGGSLIGSAGGGAGVLGLFIALQQMGILPANTPEKPQSTEEIRREIAMEQARASLLEHLQQSARSNSERLQQLATVMGSLEEAIGDLETEGKRAETHIKDVLDSEFGFLVQACFDDYAMKRRKKRKRRRRRGVGDDEEEEDPGDRVTDPE